MFHKKIEKVNNFGMIFKTCHMFQAKIKYKNESLSDENKLKNASRQILEISS